MTAYQCFNFLSGLIEYAVYKYYIAQLENWDFLLNNQNCNFTRRILSCSPGYYYMQTLIDANHVRSGTMPSK